MRWKEDDGGIRQEVEGKTKGRTRRESIQEEETDTLKWFYSENYGWDPLAGKGSEAWLLSLRNNTVNYTFITFHSCNSHIYLLYYLGSNPGQMASRIKSCQ